MHDRIELVLETAVILAALITIPLTIVQTQGATSPLVETIDWAVWTVFLAEYATMVAISQDRWGYTRRNLLNVAVIVLSFPALPTFLELSRLVRLARVGRLVRVLRLTVVIGRGLRALQQVFGRSGMVYAFALTAFLILAGGGLVAVVEPNIVGNGFWDGVWWAIETLTAVLYGDVSAPVTIWGRLVSIALMVAGIGLVSVLAASIAAYFIGQEEGVDLKHLAKRMDRIEKMLQQLVQEQTEKNHKSPENGAEQ